MHLVYVLTGFELRISSQVFILDSSFKLWKNLRFFEDFFSFGMFVQVWWQEFFTSVRLRAMQWVLQRATSWIPIKFNGAICLRRWKLDWVKVDSILLLVRHQPCIAKIQNSSALYKVNSYLFNKRRVANKRRVWKKYINLINKVMLYEEAFENCQFFDFHPIFHWFFSKMNKRRVFNNCVGPGIFSPKE